MGDESSVRVAVRIRPQSAREVIDMCRVCTTVTPREPQVTLGADKAFTFDYVFDMMDVQTKIYELCAASLVAGSLEGYNATILAYGQTGSGKTYTMGTGFETDVTEETLGIIPRAITHLFEGIQSITEQAKLNGDNPPDVSIQAQFLELYNEEIIDLFDDTRDYGLGKMRSNIKIHEDSSHSIYVMGATSKSIRSAAEAMSCLRQGALSRTTASTAMNSQSSRSHAIFTLHIQQKRLVKVEDDLDAGESGPDVSNKEFETLTAKFHFVDLAGSERLKRTGATGDRAKEGISINCGLLALGNVISALGDKTKRAIHIPYRDSKLTRLLQDSLGGNSRTVMIACVSPSDRDFMESLNTLKYANRARNIQNKIRLNQDKSSKTILILRNEIQQLQLELLEYKQGKRVVNEDGEEQVNDMYQENIMLQSEVNNLRTRTKAMQETIDDLTKKNCHLLALKASGVLIKNNTKSGDGEKEGEGDSDVDDCSVKEIITGYCGEIEDLRSKLLISEHTNSQLRKSLNYLGGPSNSLCARGLSHSPSRVDDLVDTNLIAQAKEDVARNLNILAKKKRLHSENEEERHSDSDSNDSASDSDTNSDDSKGSADSVYSAELANLTTEIDIKQKLIAELEKSNKRMQGMKQHYEDKFQQLQMRIKNTEEERDTVLTSLTNSKSQPTEKMRKVREEYEHKLNMMQKEMRNLTDAKKEYQKLLRSTSSYENQVKNLRAEVNDMKSTRVKLFRKMKEETNKHKELEVVRNREIAKLKKESRKAQNLIRNLESDKKTKEVILKRKQEEVNMLRKQSRARNPTFSLANKTKGDLAFGSPKAAKIKWQNLEKNIASNTMNKQSVMCLETDLEKLVSERQEKNNELKVKLRKLDDHRIKYPLEKDFHKDLEDEIETLRANLDYINDSITEVQRSIIMVEDTKETLESGDLVSGLKTMPEVSYIIEKLYTMSINQSLIAAQRESVIRELEAKLNHTENEFHLQRELLSSLYGSRDQDNNMTGSLTMSMSHSMPSSNEGSSKSSSPTPVDNMNGNANTPSVMNTTFVYPSNNSTFTVDKDSKRKTNLPREFNGGTNEFLDRLQMPPPMSRSSEFNTSGVPLSLRSLKNSDALISPSLPRRTNTSIDFTSTSSSSSSPRLQRRGTFVLSTHTNLTPLKPGSIDHGFDSSCSPPASPPTFRRSVSREEQSQNVFSRLTSGSIPPTEPVNKGMIIPYDGKVGTRSPLVCTHVCQGHVRPVLSMDATDDLLFSASKDKTVRVWDLCEGKQLHSLGRHPTHVTCVKFDRTSRLVCSVSSSYVKVWDMRTSNVLCVQTLCSSGTNLSTSSSLSSQVQMGETPINAIALDTSGRILYMATGEKVKIWDLSQGRVIGTLSGGHTAPIMTMIADGGLVITGSKDHYIKVFDVNTDLEDCSSSSPKMNLEPPHYDGIQSLAMRDNILFSGSRDYVIKKWNLNRQELITSQSNAHKNWVCGLAFVPSQPLLLSACRSGTLKLWATDPFTVLGDMKAHSDSINCIATNDDLVFTGSNGSSNNMYIWRLNSRLDSNTWESNS